MAKMHINPVTGGVGKCHAQMGKCPYGGSDGLANHYDTKKEAVARSEELMAASYGSRSFIGMTKDEEKSHKLNMKRASKKVKDWTKAELRKSPQKVMEETLAINATRRRIIESEAKTKEIVKALSAVRSNERQALRASELKDLKRNAEISAHREHMDEAKAKREAFEAKSPEEREAILALGHNRARRREIEDEKAYNANIESQAALNQQRKEDSINAQRSMMIKAKNSLNMDEEKLPTEERHAIIRNRYLELELERDANMRRTAAREAEINS